MKSTGQSVRGNQSQSKSRKAVKETPVLPFEAIIMAGGRGERLSPLTDKLPKPLLRVGDRPIVEYTVDRLIRAGVRHFTFCVNYLGEMIRDHFGDGEDRSASFSYIFEQLPLGTIGGVSLKEEFKYDDLLVINGDLLTTINFDRFYAFFLEQDADMAVATIPYRVNLPYGILELDERQELVSIREKPVFTYHINTGIYFVRRELLRLIPENTRFDAIDLIAEARARDCRISSFPLLDYWIDIGQMDDYTKAQEDVQYLDL